MIIIFIIYLLQEANRLLMNSSRRIGEIICQWPSRPIGLIELIGGSYLSIKPEITYRKLISELFNKHFAIHALSYIPRFDHQIQANQAWKNFRSCRKIIEKRVGLNLNPIRLGHSLGCKLHLLSPDCGRNCKGLIALSFNNFKAIKSIPMLGKLSEKLNFQTEFSPSPKESLNIINEHYEQKNNILISFNNDKLDQSDVLFKCLKERPNDNSSRIILAGDHLTPVSIGLREKLLNTKIKEDQKYKSIELIVNHIYKLMN